MVLRLVIKGDTNQSFKRKWGTMIQWKKKEAGEYESKDISRGDTFELQT